jgi:hypothetical protein
MQMPMADNFPYFIDKDDKYEYFRIKKTQLIDMWGYEKFITKRLKKRTRVPAYVFERYVAFFKWNDHEKSAYYKRIIAEKKPEVIDFFKDDKDYYFSGHVFIESMWGNIEWMDVPIINDKGEVEKPKTDNKPKERKQIKRKYSFEDMIDEVVGEIEHFMIKDKKTRADKTEFLIKTHDAITQYISRYFNKEERDEYIGYKTKVIAGYIALVFGYELSQTAPMETKRNIYNAVKYTFNKK